MKYESATISDLPTVYNIVQQTIKVIYPQYYPVEVVDFFCKHHSRDAIRKDIEHGNVGVLKLDNEIIATGCFADNHITRVYVLPEYQHKGYGTFIVKTLEEQISSKYDKVYLDASLPAAALYEKLGYTVIKHEKYPVENGVVLAYEVMGKELHKIIAEVNYDGGKLVSKKGEYIYKKATIADIDELVKTRITVLRAANRLPEDADMTVVEQESYKYYNRALQSGEHIAYLVYDEAEVVGVGGVSFYQVMPTYHNPSGEKAYIMNMYTHPNYRRLGIAFKTLDLLVKEAKSRDIGSISLEATKMGRGLYEKYGFVEMKDEMELL